MKTADAVIIGGGLIGTSIAFRLASLFNKVILVEKGEIGGRTSSSCDKAIFLQSKKPGYPIKLAKASRDIYNGLEDELDFPFEFKPSGGMIVIENETHLPFMEGFVQKQSAAGIKVDMLDQKEALSRQPGLDENIIGATYCAEDAEVNPLLLTQAFAEGAMREGVEVWSQTEVLDIVTEHHKVTEVKTSKGNISTGLVINAAGPFAGEIAEMTDLELPIKPRRGVILISEKLAPVLKGSMLCSQYILTKHLSGIGEQPPYGIGLSLGQTDSGNLLIGGSREFVGFDTEVKSAVPEAIANYAAKIVPLLKNVKIIRMMCGFRPFTGDGLPIIDKAPNVEGLIIAAGHEGDGIALAPITGILTAALINGSRHELLPPLQLDRFKKDII